MGLRFSCVAGWGWVAEIGACIAGCVHPLEKSAADFVDTSIHRLASRKKILPSSARCGLENDPRNVCRNALETVVL
jgi:hypothetical protein